MLRRGQQESPDREGQGIIWTMWIIMYGASRNVC